MPLPPKLWENMTPLLILVLYFDQASAPKKWGQRHGHAFAPKIEEGNGSTNKHGTNFLPCLCPKGFIITASLLDLPATAAGKKGITYVNCASLLLCLVFL